MKHIFHDPKNQRLDILDSRYYTNDNGQTYYPSVTHVLQIFPKEWGFENWLKSVGFNAEIIIEKAAKEGSIVHDAIDRYLNGESINWLQDGKAIYELHIWQMIAKFVEFWTAFEPEIIANELNMVSVKYGLGGTLDIVCRIKGELWLLDAKTSNYIQKSHELQLAAYAEMWNELNPSLIIQRTGIVHLKADTRGPDKSGKNIQGKGWKVHEFDRHYSEAFKTFQHIHAIWKELNPNYKPAIYTMPDSFQLKKEPEIIGNGELPLN